MTVETTVLGLMPLLLETGIGADVSARTAAPVFGGLWSCPHALGLARGIRRVAPLLATSRTRERFMTSLTQEELAYYRLNLNFAQTRPGAHARCRAA